MSPSEVPSETERLQATVDNQRRFYQEEIVRREKAEKQVAEAHEMLWGIELLDGATYGVTPNTRQEAERVAATVPGAKVREVRNCRWSGVTLYDVLAPPAEDGA